MGKLELVFGFGIVEVNSSCSMVAPSIYITQYHTPKLPSASSTTTTKIKMCHVRKIGLVFLSGQKVHRCYDLRMYFNLSPFYTLFQDI